MGLRPERMPPPPSAPPRQAVATMQTEDTSISGGTVIVICKHDPHIKTVFQILNNCGNLCDKFHSCIKAPVHRFMVKFYLPLSGQILYQCTNHFRDDL